MSLSLENGSIREEPVELPSEQSFALVFAVVTFAIAYFWQATPWVFWPFLVSAGAFAALGLSRPLTLAPLNRAWFAFGLALGRIMTPIVMFVLFAAVIVPAGLVMRMFRDPLLRRPGAHDSYWQKRDRTDAPVSSMNNQF